MQFTFVYTKLFSDWSILYLPGNPTSSTWRQTQYLFSVRSLLKQKEWTYESNLLVRNQLYDWYIHRQGWCSCFWCGKKALPFSLINRGEWPIILFSKSHGGGRLKTSHIIILKHSHRLDWRGGGLQGFKNAISNQPPPLYLMRWKWRRQHVVLRWWWGE